MVWKLSDRKERVQTKRLFQRVVCGEKPREPVFDTDSRGRSRAADRVVAKSLKDGQGNVTEVCSIGHDVTALNDIQGKLVQSERLAAIGQMIAGLAHESRNALQRATATLDMLALDLSARSTATG
ncbi:MAG: hypothetical protein R3C01_12945 [Planctomycetaceae bacterium]